MASGDLNEILEKKIQILVDALKFIMKTTHDKESYDVACNALWKIRPI